MHLLNARDNTLVPLLFSLADGDPIFFRELINKELDSLKRMLDGTNIKYESLKSSLVPSSKGRQVVFLYNWLVNEGSNYAVDFAAEYLPILREDLRSSVLHGDLLRIDGRIPKRDLRVEVVSDDAEAINWDTQYGVYFTNLRDADIPLLHNALANLSGYSGYIDVTFGGPLRDYFSRTLNPIWVICKGTVILSHGGDDPTISNYDPVGFPFREKYNVISLLDGYFDAFLSYKIEHSDGPQSDLDRVINLVASTGVHFDLGTLDIQVHVDKLAKYLLVNRDKLRLMTSAGLQSADADELANIIDGKFMLGYIYDMRTAPGATPTFAVSAEFQKPSGGVARRLLALKYDRTTEGIALVSIY